MSKKDSHLIDNLGADLKVELTSRLQAVQAELRGSVPVGERRLSPQEKLQRFLALKPQERDYFRAQLGDRWGKYEEEQLRYVVSILGGAAMNLLPYIAPTMAAALEADNPMVDRPEVGNEEEITV